MNVVIGAGHRNNQGGNVYEADMNGKKCRAIMDLFAKLGGKAHFGFDLRCYTPDNGLGWSSLDLNEVPVTAFQDPEYPVDLMVELHSEGSGRQGAFVIYPDWGDDVDVDIRDHGKLFVDALDEATGMGYRTLPEPGGVGLMSEKQTGVAISYKARLGVFRDTEQFNVRTSRTIFEQGAHDVVEDLEVMNGPSYLHLQAVAFFDGVARFFDATAPGWFVKPVEYVAPAKVPFALGVDLGWQNMGKIRVYSFLAHGVATGRVIKRAWAQNEAPVSGEAYVTGDDITLCGEMMVPDQDDPAKIYGWYLDKDGNRIRRAKVATAFKVVR
jgi:hypothetical protein